MPNEVWRGKKVRLAHLKVFGCVFYVHDESNDHNKLDAKTIRYFFIGYGDEQFDY